MSQYPKVLLVNPETFGPETGTGITLTHLFAGWPSNRIACAHSDSAPLSVEICSDCYRLTRAELGRVWPFSMFERKTATANTGSAAVGATSRVVRAKRTLAGVLGAEGLGERGSMTPGLNAWVKHFAPDIIYTHLGGLSYLRLVRKISAATGVPTTLHFMDDWPSSKYSRGLLAPYFRFRMRSELRHAIQHANGLMSISPAMRSAYQERYGRDFPAFSNALTMKAWENSARTDWGVSSLPTFVYSGSLVANAQLDSLMDIARATGRLNARGVKCVLQIRSPSIGAHAFHDMAHVAVGPTLDDSEIARYLAKADVLLLPVNFDAPSATYVRYSNPTKLPAYMISGAPILAYGPRAVDQIRRAEADGWGLALTERDPAKLDAALLELISNVRLRETLGRRAQEVAKRDHDIEQVAPAFQAALAAAWKSGREA